MASSEHRRGALEMSLAMLMSGTIGWLVVSSQQSALDVAFLRCVFGAAALAIVCARRELLRRDLLSWRTFGFAVLGGAAIVFNWVLLFASYSRASISMATTVYNTQPFMLVAFGAVIFRERISASTLTWLALAFVGLVLIVRVEPAVLATPGHYLTGVALAFGAALLWAVSSLVTKHLKGTSPYLLALITALSGVVLLAPFVHYRALPDTGAHWLEVATLGVVNTGVMYVLMYGAIQKLPTSMTGALSFIYPVVAIVVDRVAFGQKLAWAQVAGALLVLLAAAGVNLGWRVIPRRPRAINGYGKLADD